MRCFNCDEVLGLLLRMTIENLWCRGMLLKKDHNLSVGMDYIEMKRRGSFTRRILLVAVVCALLIFMVRRPSSLSASTKVIQLACSIWLDIMHLKKKYVLM